MDKNKAASTDPCAAGPSKPKPIELDKPQLNSSRYEAYAIQNAIRKLGNVRAEVEAEVMAAIASAGKSTRPERTVAYPNYLAAGAVGVSAYRKSGKGTGGHHKGSRNACGSAVIMPTGAGETQQLVYQRVFDQATKKLNVHPNERLYHDLLELNVPPTTVKLKRAPQCEKKVDPAPSLEDYIRPQYCSIKPVRDYLGTWAKCKIPEPSKEFANSPVWPDPYQDDDEYRKDCREPEFGVG